MIGDENGWKKQDKIELDLAIISGRWTRKDEHFELFATRKLTARNMVLWPLNRHGIFPPIGGFPPIERSHGSFLRSVQIRWENYRVYLICEWFSESNFANLPRASISFLHGTFSNGVNLFCFGHHQSVHGLTESTTKGSNPIVTCKSAV